GGRREPGRARWTVRLAAEAPSAAEPMALDGVVRLRRRRARCLWPAAGSRPPSPARAVPEAPVLGAGRRPGGRREALRGAALPVRSGGGDPGAGALGAGDGRGTVSSRACLQRL